MGTKIKFLTSKNRRKLPIYLKNITILVNEHSKFILYYSHLHIQILLLNNAVNQNKSTSDKDVKKR